MKTVYTFIAMLAAMLCGSAGFGQCPTTLGSSISSSSSSGCQFESTNAPRILFRGVGGTTPYTFTYKINGVVQPGITCRGTDDTVSVAVPTGQTGTFTYTLNLVRDANGCSQAQNASVLATINPKPVFTSATTGSVCSGSVFIYTATSSPSNTTFNWTRAPVAGINNGTAGSGSDATINETLTNATASPVVVTYVFTSSANGCSSTDNVKVTVNPLPTISIIPASGAICRGSLVTLTASGANTYQWSTGETQAAIIVAPTANTTYTVTGTDNNRCTNTGI